MYTYANPYIYKYIGNTSELDEMKKSLQEEREKWENEKKGENERINTNIFFYVYNHLYMYTIELKKLNL
jgi:cytochrome oxidase Cu insertion factor (SCO1/SenC/PrrC family)